MKDHRFQASKSSVFANSELPTELPAQGTQAARLLAALLRGMRINPLLGWKAFGIYRLSDTVLQLRKKGWPVVTDRLDVANRFGEACRVALYYLPAETIAEVKNMGIYMGVAEQVQHQEAGT